MSATLDRYLAELQAFPLLDARQEVALAQQIEALVLGHWRALLSYPPALPVIERIVAAVSASGTRTRALAPLRRKQKRSPVAARTEAARRLVKLDKGGDALKAADVQVRELFADESRARAYLERVDRARGAEHAAKGRFAAANLRLVITLARRYDHGVMPLADLIQEGNLGLMRAVERFDHRRGFRFSTYASWWIRHALSRGLSDRGRLVRVPVHALDDFARMRRAQDSLERREGRPPSSEELAAATGLSRDKLLLLRSQVQLGNPLSFDRALHADSEQTLHDVMTEAEPRDADYAIDLQAHCGRLERLMRGLSSIEATTLKLRFGLGGGDALTLREIGLHYNLSRERIRQIEADALRKLRAAIQAEAELAA